MQNAAPGIRAFFPATLQLYDTPTELAATYLAPIEKILKTLTLTATSRFRIPEMT